LKLLSRIAVTLLIAVSFAMPAVAAELTPHRAQYKVKIAVVSGQLDTELRRTSEGYTAQHVVRPTGLSRMLTRGTMDVSSTFTSETDGVKPVSYHAIDTIGKDPEARIRFDWATNIASGTVGSDEVELQLEGVSHDAVSIQYELMHDLMNGGPSDRYVMFDVDKMRVVNVRNSGRKTVKTDAGSYDVIGIQHQREGSSRVTTLWCAPELDYLPVIIEQHRKGKLNFRATLTEYTPI
jgi:hypothetical protein